MGYFAGSTRMGGAQLAAVVFTRGVELPSGPSDLSKHRHSARGGSGLAADIC